MTQKLVNIDSFFMKLLSLVGSAYQYRLTSPLQEQIALRPIAEFCEATTCFSLPFFLSAVSDIFGPNSAIPSKQLVF